VLRSPNAEELEEWGEEAEDQPVIGGESWDEVKAAILPLLAEPTYAQDEGLAEEAAEAAANAMALHIQTTLGVESGDVAALFFSGPHMDTLRRMAAALIRSERNFL